MDSVINQFVTVMVPTLAFAAVFFVISRVSNQLRFRWGLAFKASLSLLFLYIGIFGHFVSADGVVDLIPGFIPFPYFWSYATGVLEVLFVVGMWWPRLERLTGIAMIIYLPLVLPFNIYGWTVPGNAPSFETDPYYLYGRIPLQLVFMAFAYYGCRVGQSTRFQSAGARRPAITMPAKGELAMTSDESRIDEAVEAATAARERSYAPYSKFRMGAAVVTDSKQIVTGALVENVSLGLSMCAERSALFATVAQGAGKPGVLALRSPRTDGDLTWPCGACLQVALELGGDDLLVVVTDGRRQESARLGDLAPRLPLKN
ncbi:MAG: hypothetical protein PsegKO_28960 [Pseudohongiellaceae bacterium]